MLKKTRVNEDGQTIFVKDNDRQVLYETWAKASQFYKYQPLPLIKCVKRSAAGLGLGLELGFILRGLGSEVGFSK
jgi:hypothetical protein